MFYTVTFNPALDYIVRVDELRLGQTNRSSYDEIQFGGKGINVSFVLSQLGVPSVALGFVAGFTGDELIRAVEKCGIRADFIRLPNGNTRINVKIKGDTETEINTSGPDIPRSAVDELLAKLDLLQAGDTLVLSGSVPPSLLSSIYKEILVRLQNKGVRTVVDAAGQLLLNVLPHQPFLIKPNLDELCEIVGEPIQTEEKIIEAAKLLREKGARNVLVSLGADGAILVDEYGEVLKAKAEKITAVNTVGAGDSMIAGFLAGVDKGYDHALRLGLAAGTATAASSALATAEEILNFL